MGTSTHFGSQKTLTGKQFRDTGDLGRALTDFYKDVDAGFTSIEATIDTVSGFAIGQAPANLDLGTLATNTTLSDAQMLAGVLEGTSDASGPYTLTTRTAAQIVAAVTTAKGSAAAVNDYFDLRIVNKHAALKMTLVGGSGVTLVGGAVIQPGGAIYRFTLTNVTAAAEAVEAFRFVEAVPESIQSALGTLTNAPIRKTEAQTDVGILAGDHNLTDAEMLGGVLLFDGGGADRDLTTRTAAEIVAAVTAALPERSAEIGDTYDLHIVNYSAIDELTMVKGSGVTTTNFGNMTISAGGSGHFRLRLTNVTPAAEAVDMMRIA